MTAMMLCFLAGGLFGFAIGLAVGRRRFRRRKGTSVTDGFLKLLNH